MQMAPFVLSNRDQLVSIRKPGKTVQGTDRDIHEASRAEPLRIKEMAACFDMNAIGPLLSRFR